MNNYLKNKKILITAGPTREYIDPIRYISNDSSGKMGYALAHAAQKMGAKVTLISGPINLPCPTNIKLIPVTSAREMHREALNEGKKSNLIICTAAVADFRPLKTSKRKIKKPEIRDVRYEIQIKLTQNPDTLKTLGQRKTKNQLLIGFALETENLVPNAKKKLRDKNCDFIIANCEKNIGSDQASAILLGRDGQKIDFKRQDKRRLAHEILKNIYK